MARRILFVDHAGVLGGAELFLLDVLPRLRLPHQVCLFEDGPFRERLEAVGVAVTVEEASASVLRVAREAGLVHDLRAVPGLLRQVRRLAEQARSYDLIYANSQKAFVVAALAGGWARKPVVWHLHDILTAAHFSRVHRRLGVWLANHRAAHVVANSQATAAAFAAAGGRSDRVSVIYNGVDPGPFDAVTEEEVRVLREALALGEGPVVGCFSRLAPWKGQHVLLEALQALPGVQALLVGDALFGEEQRYADGLQVQARALGLADRVHFLGFRGDVPRLMRLCDAVVHTSVAPEPFGRVIVEAMAAETPVVAAAAGGALEIMEPARGGVLTPPGDARALADALRGLLQDPAAARRLATAGRDDAQRRFALPVIVGEVERLLCGI